MTALAQACTQLTSVNFAGCDKLTDGGVTALAQACTQLTSVNFAQLLPQADGRRRDCARAGVHAAHLRQLRNCDKLTDGGVTALAQACTQLTSVNFERCAS